jgi:hypothetical protein
MKLMKIIRKTDRDNTFIFCKHVVYMSAVTNISTVLMTEAIKVEVNVDMCIIKYLLKLK